VSLQAVTPPDNALVRHQLLDRRERLHSMRFDHGIQEFLQEIDQTLARLDDGSLGATHRSG
jgi:soluble cytochrome b562